MSEKLKTFILIIVLWICYILLDRSFTLQSERRIREHFQWKFDSLTTSHKELPRTLYDAGRGKCVLVYPDTMLYVYPEDKIKRRKNWKKKK